MRFTRYVEGLLLLLFLLPSTVVTAMEVPYEVFKTEMKESVTVSDGSLLFLDPQTNQYKLSTNDGMTGDWGGDMDFLKAGTFVRLNSIEYTITFHNVGKLGGDDYGDAELTVNYETGGAYKIALKNGEEILNENGEYYKQLLKNDNSDEIISHIEMQVNEGILDGEKGRKKVTVGSVDVPSATFKLTFSGGPFGTFGMKTADIKNGVYVMGDIIDNATKIVLKPGGGAEENYFKQNMYHLQPAGVRTVTVPIKGDGLKKWMAILQDGMGECSDPENPSKDSGIRFSDIWGEVSYVSCNGVMDELWEMAELGAVLHVEDRIKTGDYDDSGAVLSLQDMTTFKMRPDTEIVLSKPPGKESKIALIAGKVWGNLKRMVKDGSMNVEMSEAVLGIKGTTWIMEDDGKTSGLKVIEGEVEFMSKATGYYETVGSGEAISANASGMSEKTTFDVEAEKANWEHKEAMQKEYQDTAVFTYPEPLQEEDDETERNSPVWIIAIAVLVLGGLVAYRLKSHRSG